MQVVVGIDIDDTHSEKLEANNIFGMHNSRYVTHAKMADHCASILFFGQYECN